MNNATLYNNAGIRYMRITARAARTAFELGESLVMCPVRLNPFGAWNRGIHVRKSCLEPGETFDTITNAITAHNCSNEAGKYLAYYKEGV